VIAAGDAETVPRKERDGRLAFRFPVRDRPEPIQATEKIFQSREQVNEFAAACEEIRELCAALFTKRARES
jgi:hypothetical protein